MQSFFARLTYRAPTLLLAVVLVGCAEPGERAVNRMTAERASISETDAQYDARQREEFLDLPLLVQQDLYQPVIRWANYQPSTGLLNIDISSPRTPQADQMILEVDVRRSWSPGTRTFASLLMLDQFPAASGGWRDVVKLVDRPGNMNASIVLDGLDWRLRYRPLVRHDGMKETQAWKGALVEMRSIELINRKSGQTLWTKELLGVNVH